MHTVFQEIQDFATARLREALSRESEVGGQDRWDPDSFEREVRQWTRELGQGLLQVWGQEQAQHAQAQARLCPCGRRRQLHERQPLWWLSTFGQVQIEVPYLRCPRGHGGDRPFQRLTGLSGRSKSMTLQRVLTDFGAEKSFGQASEQLWEHYGVRLDRSSVRQVVEAQARRAEEFVAGRHSDGVKSYQSHPGHWPGEEQLIVESDGSMIRTSSLEQDTEGGLSPKRGQPKRRRRTEWREVRLTVVERPRDGQRMYGAVMESPERVGKQMFALAALLGWGDRTRVHGVGDGAPWIARQMAAVFPRQRYLLDRYHLLEHIWKAYLPEQAARTLARPDAESAQKWVAQQVERIDRNMVDDVIAECRATAQGSSEHPLHQLAGYLEHQRDHLGYAAAKQQGLPIGSGAVEGGHRHVIQARLKLPGTWWKEDTLNPMLALRTLRVNGWWEPFWAAPSNHF